MSPDERMAKLLSDYKSFERYINANTHLEEGTTDGNEGNGGDRTAMARAIEGHTKYVESPRHASPIETIPGIIASSSETATVPVGILNTRQPWNSTAPPVLGKTVLPNVSQIIDGLPPMMRPGIVQDNTPVPNSFPGIQGLLPSFKKSAPPSPILFTTNVVQRRQEQCPRDCESIWNAVDAAGFSGQQEPNLTKMLSVEKPGEYPQNLGNAHSVHLKRGHHLQVLADAAPADTNMSIVRPTITQSLVSHPNSGQDPMMYSNEPALSLPVTTTVNHPAKKISPNDSSGELREGFDTFKNGEEIQPGAEPLHSGNTSPKFLTGRDYLPNLEVPMNLPCSMRLESGDHISPQVSNSATNIGSFQKYLSVEDRAVNENPDPDEFGVQPSINPYSYTRGVAHNPSSNSNYGWKVDYIGHRSPEITLDHTFRSYASICSVAYRRDGEFIATSTNHIANLYNASGDWERSFAKSHCGEPPGKSKRSNCYIRSICFTPNGMFLITGDEDNEVRVWSAATGESRYTLVGHEAQVIEVEVSLNGWFIASGAGDGKVKCWNLESGCLLNSLGISNGPSEAITSLSIHPECLQLATGGLDNMVRVWDVETCSLMREFEGHTESIYSVSYFPDGNYLASAGLDKIIKLWDLRTSTKQGKCDMYFKGHRENVLSVTQSPDSRFLFSGSKDRTVRLWDPRNPNTCVLLQGHSNSILDIVHHPWKQSFITAGGDWRARAWSYT